MRRPYRLWSSGLLTAINAGIPGDEGRETDRPSSLGFAVDLLLCADIAYKSYKGLTRG